MTRQSSMRTTDAHAPFVTGNISDSRDARGRITKTFLTCSDNKRLDKVKPIPRWHGQTFAKDVDGWHRDDIQVGGFVVNGRGK